MITEWFIDLGVAIAQWFVGLVPADQVAVPPAFASFDSTVNGFIAPFASMGVWVPWTVVITCAGLALAVWAALWLVKAIAWVWGQIPVIGGAG